MTTGSDPFDESVLDKAIRFQNGLIAHATGGGFDGGDSEYQDLRHRAADRALHPITSIQI